MNAGLRFNLLTVVFVCIMLRLVPKRAQQCDGRSVYHPHMIFTAVLASIGFTNDANRLVLYPVENMIAKASVEHISDA